MALFLFSEAARGHFRSLVFWSRPFIYTRTALVRRTPAERRQGRQQGPAPDRRLMWLSYGPRMTVDMQRASNDTSPTLRSWRHSSKTGRRAELERRRCPSPSVVLYTHSYVQYMTAIAASLDVFRDSQSKPTESIIRRCAE